MKEPFLQTEKINDLVSATQKKELDLLDAFLRFKQIIHPEECYRALKKRYSFWTYEIQSLNLRQLPSQQKLGILRDFVFKQKERLFKNSVAPQILQGLILQNLAFLSDLQINFVLMGSYWALKVEIDGIPHYLSLEESGRVLDNQEVLDIIFSFGKVKKIDFIDILIAYLEIVQKYIDPQTASQKVLKVYDLMLFLKEGDPKTLIKRATLYKDLGYFSEALDDVKTFLHFQPTDNKQFSFLARLMNQGEAKTPPSPR